MAEADVLHHRRETASSLDVLQFRGLQWLDVAHNLAWNHRVELLQVVIRRKETSWQVIFKGNRGRAKLAAYVDAPTFCLAVEAAAELADSSYLDWHPDKYPPRVGK